VSPPIPSYLKLLRGNPGKRPLKPEPEPAIAPACPEPPLFLDAYARDEWHRVAPELWRIGLLRVTDVACLAVYAMAYSQWRQASEALARIAAGDPVMHGLLVKTADGNARRNPLVKVASDAASDMLMVAGLFGLTRVARARLGAAGWSPPPGPSKFDGLLA
jgi:P27 family predicted phage terminase small subunit